MKPVLRAFGKACALAVSMMVGMPVVSLATDEPIIIAHRGASGLRPEHTLAAYQLGIEQGADFIEPDLVMTKDGHLVARHDVYLSSTTDVADHPEFSDRRRVLAGHDDWFVFDFTLAELQTLRARQPFEGRSKEFDGLYAIPTLDEVIELAAASNTPAKVGLYIEMKRPALFEQEVSSELVETLAAQLNRISALRLPVYFQCFDIDFLRKMRPLTRVPLVYLEAGKPDAGTSQYVLQTDLSSYYDFIDGFGLYKALLTDPKGNQTNILDQLQAAGKAVHIWTARDDALPEGFERGEQEIRWLLEMGVDGVFTDFPATGVAARKARNHIEAISQEK